MADGNVGPLLTQEQAAEFLQLTAWQLREMRRKGTGPRYIRVGHRTVRYPKDELLAWLRRAVQA